MRLTGAGAPTIKPRNESSGRQGNAQYYYRSGKGSDAPLALTKGREGSVRTWPFTGLFYCAERSGKEDDHDTRNDRRRNGDGGARRPGREASVRLSGRRRSFRVSWSSSFSSCLLTHRNKKGPRRAMSGRFPGALVRAGLASEPLPVR